MHSAPIPYVRNFVWVLVLESCWAFGSWLAHPMTVMPQFVLRLGGTERWVGALPGLWAVGTGLGALLLGPVALHRRHLAAFCGWAHLLALLAWPLLAAVAFAVERGRLTPRPALWLSFGALLYFNLLLGFLVQLYFFLLSRVFPERGRGAWFGALFAVSGIVGALGPIAASRWFLHPGATLADYGRLFLATAACFFAGSLPFFLLRERPRVREARRTVAGNVSHLVALWRANEPLRRYISSRFILELGGLCMVFVATYSRTEGGLTEHAVARLGFVIVACEATACVLLGWGFRRLDGLRMPPWRSYLLAQLGAQGMSMVALLAAATGPARPAAVLLAVAGGLRLAAEFVIHPNILLELGGRRSRLDAIALGAFTLMPASLGFMALSGRAIEAFGHRTVFLVAVAVLLPALVALLRLAARPRATLGAIR